LSARQADLRKNRVSRRAQTVPATQQALRDCHAMEQSARHSGRTASARPPPAL